MNDDSGIDICSACDSSQSRPIRLGVHDSRLGRDAQVIIEFRVCKKCGTLRMPKEARDILLEDEG